MINDKLIKKINSVFNPKYFKIYCMYDAKKYFLFGVKNREYLNEEPLDPWYLIDKKSNKIKGFLPHLNKELFEYALEHEIDISK